MNSSRVLGGLLSIGSALVAIAHIYFGYFTGGFSRPPQGLAFALPVTVFILVASGLGFWLGWIMVTTKEPEPAPTPESEESEKEPEGIEGIEEEETETQEE